MSDVEAARQAMRIKLLEKYGIIVSDCTSEQWLDLAQDAQDTRISLGPFDPAYEYFFNCERRYLEAALLAST